MAAIEQPSANFEMQKVMDQFAINYGNMAAEFTGVSKACKEFMPMFAKMIEAVVEEQANKMEKIVDAKIAEAISCMTPVRANWNGEEKMAIREKPEAMAMAV